MKILTVVGARPQFIKAVTVSTALRNYSSIRERILHTGQHYDSNMSDVFFRELKISKPYKNLNARSGAHGEQTAKMLAGIEKECVREKPDWLLIYGDTNSTLAGALAATKLHIPVAHVEAGLRSFNPAMPEEINRVVSDRISNLLFVPTETAVENLKREGIFKGVHRVGDVMLDAIYLFRDLAERLPEKKVEKLIPKGPYFVLTLHRQENTDFPKRFSHILRGLSASSIPFIFPLHPRTQARMKKLKLVVPPSVRAISPVGYMEMILLQMRSEGVWTDSGGVQKEAAVLGKACFTLRDQTEWVETVQTGWNHLVPADAEEIRKYLKWGPKVPRQKFPIRKFYGDGHAAGRIAKILARS
jgi:UDP-GlcNAc3NAcA epimerase